MVSGTNLRGERYYNAGTDEYFTVIEYEDCGYPMVIVQYDNGKPAEIIASKLINYMRLPSSAQERVTRPQLEHACAESEHDFGHHSAEQVLDVYGEEYSPRCRICRLSVITLSAYADQDISYSVTGDCDHCQTTLRAGDTTKPRYYDYESIMICEECFKLDEGSETSSRLLEHNNRDS